MAGRLALGRRLGTAYPLALPVRGHLGRCSHIGRRRFAFDRAGVCAPRAYAHAMRAVSCRVA